MSQYDVHTILRAEPVRVYGEMSASRVERRPDRQEVGDFVPGGERRQRRAVVMHRVGLETLPDRLKGRAEPDDVALLQELPVRLSEDDASPGGDDLRGSLECFLENLALPVTEVGL